jgi:hypothetical protein
LGLLATGRRSYPRGQFGEAERLHDVVVRSTVESSDPIGHLVPCGQHHHREPPTGLTQTAADSEPITARKHDVEHNSGVVDLASQPLRVHAIVADVDRVAFLLETPSQQGRQAGLVLGHEQPHPTHGNGERCEERVRAFAGVGHAR